MVMMTMVMMMVKMTLMVMMTMVMTMVMMTMVMMTMVMMTMAKMTLMVMMMREQLMVHSWEKKWAPKSSDDQVHRRYHHELVGSPQTHQRWLVLETPLASQMA